MNYPLYVTTPNTPMGEGSFTRFIYGKLVEVRRQAGTFEIGQADVTENFMYFQ